MENFFIIFISVVLSFLIGRASQMTKGLPSSEEIANELKRLADEYRNAGRSTSHVYGALSMEELLKELAYYQERLTPENMQELGVESYETYYAELEDVNKEIHARILAGIA